MVAGAGLPGAYKQSRVDNMQLKSPTKSNGLPFSKHVGRQRVAVEKLPHSDPGGPMDRH